MWRLRGHYFTSTGHRIRTCKSLRTAVFKTAALALSIASEQLQGCCPFAIQAQRSDPSIQVRAVDLFPPNADESGDVPELLTRPAEVRQLEFGEDDLLERRHRDRHLV